MNLKKLRTSKNLSLDDAIKGFTFPHKVWVYQDAPLDRTLLHKYENGTRKMPEGFIEKYEKHIELQPYKEKEKKKKYVKRKSYKNENVFTSSLFKKSSVRKANIEA